MSGRISKASGTKITKKQKYKLMEMMKESPQLAYGNRGAFMKTAVSRETAVRRWKEIAKTLNSMDNTAQKEWEGWRKSWSDIRTKMRDDWSLVVQAHLNQNSKRNQIIRIKNNKIYKNDDDDHVVTVPKIEPESDDSSSGTDSDLMTNHDGPKILRKSNISNASPVRFNIHHIQIDDDNENNDDDDDDDNDEDDNDDDDNNDEDNEENDNRNEEVQKKHQKIQRTTRSKSYVNPIIIDPPVISIKTKPPFLKKKTNGINDRVKIVPNKTTESLIQNANNCSVRIKKIPNNINEKVTVQNNTNNTNGKKKSSFTNFMKEYVEHKAKVKENYYTKKLELLQRDVVAKESMASSLKILINRKRDF